MASAPRLATETPVKLVVFDMAGTTVDDMVDGQPVVAVAMQGAFVRFSGSRVPESSITSIRGLEKKDALRKLLVEQSGEGAEPPTDATVDELYGLFEEELERCLPRIDKEIPGASDTFRALQASGVGVCVGSGFPQKTVDTIVHTLGWTGAEEKLVDHAFSSVTLGHGRPHPAMVLAAMEATGVDDPNAVVKVGDTAVDVEEGKAAGCHTVAVLSGTQGREKLEAAGPSLILDSVADLPAALALAEAAEQAGSL